jgi:hypothetical protein
VSAVVAASAAGAVVSVRVALAEVRCRFAFVAPVAAIARRPGAAWGRAARCAAGRGAPIFAPVTLFSGGWSEW